MNEAHIQREQRETPAQDANEQPCACRDRDGGDDFDAVLAHLLSKSCRQSAPEHLRARVVRRFSSVHVDSEGRIFYTHCEERHET